MIGELRVVDSVPAAFAVLVEEEMRRVLAAPSPPSQFRIGCSGGSSGAQSFARLAASEGVDWARLSCYFVDERCVAADSPDANQRTLREALSPRLATLGGFFPMSCERGAADYEATLRAAGPLHLCQLGLGPDGHTASLFPGSPALDAPSSQWVTENLDRSGRNVHPRLTLTFSAIAEAARAVVTVIGADKAEALAAVDAREELPATTVDSERVLWLCDAPAAAGLGGGRAR